MNTVQTAIKKALAEAAALEHAQTLPGEDVVKDRAQRRYQLQARFDALLVEACAPGYIGDNVSTDEPRFRGVPEEEREALRAEHEAQRIAMARWWWETFREEIRPDSLLDAMLEGVWTFVGWPPDMIDGRGSAIPVINAQPRSSRTLRERFRCRSDAARAEADDPCRSPDPRPRKPQT